MPTSIDRLRNIGPKSAAWLEECGIPFVEDLREVGAVLAFRMVSQSQCGVSINLLWALAAGLQNRDWRDLTNSEKQQLRLSVAAED